MSNQHPNDPPETTRFDSDTIGHRVSTDKFLTKFRFGKHWWYIDTKHKFKQQNRKLFGRWSGITSYKKVKEI